MSKLSHIDSQGQANMVDVGAKESTSRLAVARGRVIMQPETLSLILEGNMKKGDVLGTARIAGIMAAKKTSDLIPLCHPLNLTSVQVDLTPDGDNAVMIEARVKVTGQTGVEMEALTAVSVAALTLYDMAKAVDRGMTIEKIELVEKDGGKSGHYSRPDEASDEKDRTPKRTGRAKKTLARPRVVADITTPARVLPAHMMQSKREAFRSFVRNNRLQISKWASDAGVRPGEVFGFLNGQSAQLNQTSAERLARAAGVSPQQMFGE